MMEEWRDIQGCDGWKVSSSGNILGIRGNLMKLRIQNSGYYYTPYIGKSRKMYCVHRLVALAFIPNPDNKPEVDHINRDKTDNRVENLRWLSRSEQMIHSPCPVGVTGHRHISLKNTVFRVCIKRNNKNVFDKTFKTLLEAIKARDEFLSGK